ncbi:MAG: RNA-binding domain-containing protein [Thermoplasmatota archaeon]
MARFHWLRFRTSIHGTEDPERVRAAFHHITGLPDAEVSETRIESHHGGEVVWLELELTRAADIKAALRRLIDEGIRDRFLRELDARFDDDRVFYFRFNKQRAFAGHFSLDNTSDTIQCRLRVEAHPGTRENGFVALKEHFEGMRF